MPWNAPFKDRSKVGIGDDQSGREVAATEVTSGCETIASGEKIGKSGRKVGGGKVVKVPKVAKEKVNNSKKDARPKPSIDGLTFSVTPVKMKKVSLSKAQVVALHRHMKQMHMQNAHTTDCNHCGKQFSSNRVKEHIRSVHGPATFGCDFCDKMFTTNFKLTSHKKYIHTERNLRLPMRCVCKTVKQPKCTQCAPVNPQ